MLQIEWIYSGDLEKGKGWEQFEGLDGIVVPGGFGERGIEGKIAAARWARENQSPLSGSMPGYAGDVHRVCPARVAE